MEGQVLKADGRKFRLIEIRSRGKNGLKDVLPKCLTSSKLEEEGDRKLAKPLTVVKRG